MDLKDIKSLIQFISKLDLPEVNIELEGVKVHVKKNHASFELPSNVVQSTAGNSLPLSNMNLVPVVSDFEIPISEKTSNFPHEEKEKNYITIKSPIIGTFYSKPSPEKPAFVEVGKEIKVGDPLCIIEAMKLFNEIESEVNGKIIKILIKDASPVEYDQPLFLVDPN